MSLEGELQIGLRTVLGRVDAVQIRSTRPDVAAALLKGRSAAEVQAAVPMLFSVCGRSQAAACTLACAAAAGLPPAPERLRQLQADVTAERVREAALQVLLHWPRWLNPAPEVPGPAALAAARAVQAYDGDPDSAATVAISSVIADAAWGMSPEAWLQIDSVAALADWARHCPLATARFVDQLMHATLGDPSPSAAPDPAPEPVALLPAAPDTAWLRRLAAELQANPHFEREPTWNGAPAETGGLARLQQDPLIQALAGLVRPDDAAAAQAGAAPAALPHPDRRMLGRFVARLRELAGLLARPAPQQAGWLSLPGATGLAWVHNARGLLVHLLQLEQDRVQVYRIVAPTEWNFHPRGALVQALLHGPATDPAELHDRATRLVHSLDPCVACRIEVQHA